MRPIGLWSISMTLSTAPAPSTESWAPGSSRAPKTAVASARYRMSVTSVLLPEPETPVTAVNVPSGKRTSTSRRLWARAPTTSSALPLPVRRRVGMGTCALAPQVGAGDRVAARPGSPPAGPRRRPRRRARPRPGPMSTIQSAVRMVSSSCSTTSSVLPRSRSRVRVAMSLALSRWCRPMDGSSRMYSTPIRLEPIWVASRMRWASPPDRVSLVRSTVR